MGAVYSESLDELSDEGDYEAGEDSSSPASWLENEEVEEEEVEEEEEEEVQSPEGRFKIKFRSQTITPFHSSY